MDFTKDKQAVPPLPPQMPQAKTAGPSAAEVADYLRRHPDFLVLHPELLSVLTPPRLEGGERVVDMQHFMLLHQRGELARMKAQQKSIIATTRANLAGQAREIGGFRVVAARVDGLDAKALREGVDGLKQRLVDCVVLLASASEGKVALAGGVNGSALAKIKAGDVVAHVAAQIGGKGGGRADMAQGGGVDSPTLDAALAGVQRAPNCFSSRNFFTSQIFSTISKSSLRLRRLPVTT